jgi:hypothetical protein
MAGDVEGLNGKGSHSALGQRYFRDEAFYIPHSQEVSLTCYYIVWQACIVRLMILMVCSGCYFAVHVLSNIAVCSSML